VVAESTDSRADDRVQVQPGESQLKLTLQRNGNPDQALAPTVSVAQMMVPKALRGCFEKRR
jgi:hypothetical protein